MNLKNLSIRVRLLSGFGLILAIATGTCLLGIGNLASVNDQAKEISSSWLPSVKALGVINGHLADLRIKRILLLTATPDQKEDAAAGVEALTAALKKDIAAYPPLISGPAEQALYDQASAQLVAYMETVPAQLKMFRAGDMEGVRAIVTKSASKAYGAADKLVDELIELNDRGSQTAAVDAGATYERGRWQLLGSLVAMLFAGVGIGWWTSRHLTTGIARCAAASARMADGDLSVPVAVVGNDELGRLLQSLETMRAHLGRTFGGVMRNAEGVATASAQIASGNNDLSARTEKQASALQQTAASMEELGGTVRQNADTIRQATQCALGASSVAVQGGEVVGRVVETMRGINDSSKRIADIIGTIDGIAFQTNILALNAAVEAARAGEQGRGFAVVASEVRSLAQRSADAAKEIKQLISASVERVGHGTALVDEAGTTMTQVVTAIRRVTDLMGEIDAASTGQQAGVTQVGAAVTQMDEATQQNAALVEESAAAADSLKVQARQLVEAVAVFRLEPALGRAEATGAGRLAAPLVSTAVVSTAAKPFAAAKSPSSRVPSPSPARVPARRPAATPRAAGPAAAPAAAAPARSDTDEWTTF